MRSPYGIAKKVFYCKPARNILLTLVEPDTFTMNTAEHYCSTVKR